MNAVPEEKRLQEENEILRARVADLVKGLHTVLGHARYALGGSEALRAEAPPTGATWRLFLAAFVAPILMKLGGRVSAAGVFLVDWARREGPG